MSDGGFNIDEFIKKRRHSTQLRSPVFNKRTGNLVSFPDMPSGKEEPIARKINDIKYAKKTGDLDIYKYAKLKSDSGLKPAQETSRPKMRLSVSIGETKRIGNLELTKTNKDFEIKFIKFDRNIIENFKKLVSKRRWQPAIKKWKIPYESEQQLLDYIIKYMYNNF